MLVEVNGLVREMRVRGGPDSRGTLHGTDISGPCRHVEHQNHLPPSTAHASMHTMLDNSPGAHFCQQSSLTGSRVGSVCILDLLCARMSFCISPRCIGLHMSNPSCASVSNLTPSWREVYSLERSRWSTALHQRSFDLCSLPSHAITRPSSLPVHPSALKAMLRPPPAAQLVTPVQ